MSTAHKGSILPVKNVLIPIEEKDHLFRFDYNENSNRLLAPDHGLSFNGVDSRVDFGNIQEIHLTDVTIEFYARVDNITQDHEFVVKSNTHATNKPLLIWFDNEVGGGDVGSGNLDTISVLTYDGSTQHWVAAPSGSVADTKWHHYAIVINPTNNKIEIYIDKKLVVSNTKSWNGIQSNSYPVMLGDVVTTTIPLTGSMKEVRIWNVARTSTEIARDADTILGGGEYGLVGYWRLDHSVGMTAEDYSVNGYDGTISGSIEWLKVATIRSGEGKFGGAIAVESRAENFIETVAGESQNWPDWSHWANASYWDAQEQYEDPDMGKVFKGTPNSGTTYLFDYYPYSVTSGEKYTLSFYLKASETKTVSVKFYIVSNVGGQHGIGEFFDTVTLTTEWQRFWGTMTVTETVSGGAGIGFQIDEPVSGHPTHYYAAKPQFEHNPMVTSFVKGIRGQGRLWYPKTALNKSSFTVSLWFNIPYMYRASVDDVTDGISTNWYHPIIEWCPTTDRGSVDIGYSIAAGPQPASWNRRIVLRSPGSITGNIAIQDDTWYHCLGTYDGSVYKVYINGEEEVSHASATPPTEYDDTMLMVGGGYYGATSIKIDDLCISEEVLTIEEARAIYESQAPLYDPYDYYLISG